MLRRVKKKQAHVPPLTHTHTHTHHRHTHQEGSFLEKVGEPLLGVGLEAAPGSHIDRQRGGEGVRLQRSHRDSIAQLGHLVKELGDLSFRLMAC